MSSEWAKVKIEQIAEVKSGKRLPLGMSLVDEPTPFPYIRLVDVSNGIIQKENLKFLPPETRDSIKRYVVNSGDVGLAIVGHTIGMVFYVDAEFDDVNLTENAARITNFSKSINYRYLYYYLTSPIGQIEIISRKVGSAQGKLPLYNIKSIEISIPTLNEQNSIVSILDALSSRIDLLRETNKTLEAIAQAIFKSWFVDFDPVRAKQEGREPEGMDADTAALFPDSFEESELGLIPKGWVIKCLGDITERITKGTTPTTLKRPFVESGINFIKVESITGDGEFIPEKFAFIDNETHELLKRSQLQCGDVLITIAGTIGRVAVITDDFLPANTNQAIALIRPDENIFPGGLIKYFLQRKDSRQAMVERVVQAVQANLSLGSISNLKIIVPPPEAVKQLHRACIEQIDASKLNNQQQIRTLSSLRDTLLPRLISGQLRLPDAESIINEVTP